MFLKDAFRTTDFIDPKRLDSDLDSFYLSTYLINEMREFYTAKERQSFYTGKHIDCKPRMVCKKNWPICYSILEKCKAHPEKTHSLFKCQFLLSNFKFDHFSIHQRGGLNWAKMSPMVDMTTPRIAVPENDLLIERQRHTCECRDEDYERMKAEVRSRIGKQLANFNAIMKQPRDPKNTKSFGKEANKETKDVYDEFIKKNTDNNSRKRSSDLSHSSPHKMSHDHISHLDSMYQSEFNVDNVNAQALANEEYILVTKVREDQEDTEDDQSGEHRRDRYDGRLPCG